MRRVIFLLLTLIFLISCGPSWRDVNKIKGEKKQLAEKNDQLQVEIENIKNKLEVSQKENVECKAALREMQEEFETLKFGASRLLSEAQANFDNENIDEAKEKLKTLLDKHPTSEEAVIAVKVLAKIKNKEDERARVKRERVDQAVSKLDEQYDEFKEIYWYFPKKFLYPNSVVAAYIGKKTDGIPWLRLRIKHGGLKLDVQYVEVKVDSKIYRINGGEKDQTNFLILSSTLFDLPVTTREFGIINEIIQSKNALVRYYESNMRFTTEVIEPEVKKSLQTVMEAYEALQDP